MTLGEDEAIFAKEKCPKCKSDLIIKRWESRHCLKCGYMWIAEKDEKEVS